MRSASGSARNCFSTSRYDAALRAEKPESCGPAPWKASAESAAASEARAKAMRMRWHPLRRPELFDYLARGVLARAGRDSSAWMRARSTQIEIAQRRPVLGPAENRAHREQLIERRFTVQDVSAGQPEGLFEIRRGDDLVMRDQVRNSRRIPFDHAHDGAEQVGAAIAPPVAGRELVRRVLNVDRHHVLT